MRRVLLLGIVLTLGALGTGCDGKAVSPGQAASLPYVIVEVQEIEALATPGPVTVDPIGSDLGDRVSPEWLSKLTQYARSQAESAGELAGGKRPLRLVGSVVHLETVTTAGQLLGAVSEAIVRFRCYDGVRLVGEANIVGRTPSNSENVVPELSDAVGQGLVAWIRTSGKRWEAAQPAAETPPPPSAP
ncbi:MAG: hypothetical protein BIFFINMI_03938 [Phycisphaerae bacterium]|nr:hypothetical protein [Phycisphaerae bacterium]